MESTLKPVYGKKIALHIFKSPSQIHRPPLLAFPTLTLLVGILV